MGVSGPNGTLPRLARSSAAVLLGLLLALASAGCTGGEPAQRRVVFWDELRIDGADEAEGWGTFGEMKAAADVVVVAEIASFEMSRTFQGDAEEDLVGYGRANLKVIESLQGDPPEGLVPVEFLLGGDPESYQATADAIGKAVPGGRFLVFLRAKRGKGEDGLFRLVNSTGLWGPVDGATIGAPMSDPEFGSPYDKELSNVESFEELVAYTRSR